MKVDIMSEMVSEMTEPQRWAWALTGSGHFFSQSIELMKKIGDVDIFASKAAEEVLRMYQQHHALPETIRLFRDTTASAAPVGQFYKNIYHTLVVAPASSNTVAKCVYGISDTLVTNVFAQAGKCRIPCIYFACDTAPEMESMAPRELVRLFPRSIDLENTQKLRSFERVTLVENLDALVLAVEERLQCLNASSS